jgi:hypothetical protein
VGICTKGFLEDKFLLIQIFVTVRPPIRSTNFCCPSKIKILLGPFFHVLKSDPNKILIFAGQQIFAWTDGRSDHKKFLDVFLEKNCVPGTPLYLRKTMRCRCKKKPSLDVKMTVVKTRPRADMNNDSIHFWVFWEYKSQLQHPTFGTLETMPPSLNANRVRISS